MRCCQNSADCVVSKSTYGVRVIFGEQWDWSGPHPDGLLPAAQNCVNGQLPGNVTTAPLPTASASATTVPGVPTATLPNTNSTSSVVAAPTTTSTAGTGKPTTTPGAGGNAGVVKNAAVVVSAFLAGAIGLFMA
ncbi:hypothetical protein BGZ95_007717 [Linnemannia exigua]|uniref:Uncharacterized protein n=1 Tax=Linnemannia exigua TaxID=604196 RepID=A0AAD4CZY2_9FUNG|nr:hypothetical protein BGZ95_007717 [Linnemannia exigua]